MLDVRFWHFPPSFTFGELGNPKAYTAREAKVIFNNFSAKYKGIPTDECLTEIFKFRSSCPVSQICHDMMFGERNDTGYLLTHRSVL